VLAGELTSRIACFVGDPTDETSAHALQELVTEVFTSRA